MNPSQVRNHESDKANQTLSTRGILSEGDKQFQEHKDHNVGMNNMIQPSKKIQKCLEYLKIFENNI